MPKELEVWLLGARVGTLLQVDGRLGFVYTAEWLAQAAAGEPARPLSHSLPLQPEPFDDRATRPFFAGLLPEGDKRRLIAQALHASRQNDFALLDGIGGECAGAVTLLEPGRTLPGAPSNPGEAGASVRWLDEPALLRLLDELPQRPMLAGEEGLRLSLAGAQDKLPVVADLATPGRPRIGLPLQGSPSTHILKPAIAGADGSVFNEAFCMMLASSLKLAAAPVQILRVADRQALLVQRYDRVATADPLHPQRLHQEDFCQALGVPPEHKYQNEGGPSLAQAFELLRRATRPSAPHILRLLDVVVFNALIGNHDAHGKNFSLLYAQPTGLAPLYDALCTAVYPHLTDKMAMKLGSKYKFTEVMARHWEQFAREAGLSPAQVRRRILEIASQLPALAARQHTEFQARGDDHPLLATIVTLIAQRCELTKRRLQAPAAAGRADGGP
jgi:serine/threonine-protein kinase HipA